MKYGDDDDDHLMMNVDGDDTCSFAEWDDDDHGWIDLLMEIDGFGSFAECVVMLIN